jgi:hypothetical protein
MSRDGTGRGGVTNHLGEVYRGTGSDVYSGLVCCDASIVPTSLGDLPPTIYPSCAHYSGVNPLATIAALAERSVSLLATRSGLKIDLETENGKIDSNSRPRISRPVRQLPNRVKRKKGAWPIGWRFTEVLQGYISPNPTTGDFTVAEAKGRASASSMSAYLTIELCRSEGRHKQIRLQCFY